MSMSPKVSIVILNFNSFKDTKECLLSLQKLEYSNYEIIVVDNSSTDGSYEKLKKEFNTYNIIKSNENLGYANGNNIGIKYALENKADYICVLNNDVIVEDDFLDKIIKVMEDDKDIGLAGPCICKYHDKNIIQAMGANINLYNGLTQGKYKNYKYSDIPQKDIQVDYLGGACFVCRREVFEKIGFIPENYFLFFEETEFCYKASKRGYKLLCVYESKIYHKGSSTISKYSGLSYYFLNRNRVVFIRRNANFFEKCIFSAYIFIEAVARIILRREPLTLLKNIIHGFKADVKSIDMEMVKSFFS